MRRSGVSGLTFLVAAPGSASGRMLAGQRVKVFGTSRWEEPCGDLPPRVDHRGSAAFAGVPAPNPYEIPSELIGPPFFLMKEKETPFSSLGETRGQKVYPNSEMETTTAATTTATATHRPMMMDDDDG